MRISRVRRSSGRKSCQSRALHMRASTLRQMGAHHRRLVLFGALIVSLGSLTRFVSRRICPVDGPYHSDQAPVSGYRHFGQLSGQQFVDEGTVLVQFDPRTNEVAIHQAGLPILPMPRLRRSRPGRTFPSLIPVPPTNCRTRLPPATRPRSRWRPPWPGYGRRKPTT